ncbi:hypothetical protein [Pontiella agarivorans]|uniref:Uncharacterized protein n=1 Tax=Pontiella agarivorans TaxID=3038953 RepID=A0ABU5MYM6_9BACT|nr:hypothetical protein [Pontiella agarivorans]MDZ8119282.1 hypothetical protein [Pontiella agarivorans]
MAADFKINLAKDLTSTHEERVRFYNGMLIYQAVCAILLVLVAYLASLNLTTFLANKAEQREILATTEAVHGISKSTFRNPQAAYNELDAYSRRIDSLRHLLGRRIQLLPIVYNLFLELPEGVALQSLSADTALLSFGLVMPSPTADADAVKELRAAWERNEELMRRVLSIRPLTGERRTVGDQSMVYMQFECVLKK